MKPIDRLVRRVLLDAKKRFSFQLPNRTLRRHAPSTQKNPTASKFAQRQVAADDDSPSRRFAPSGDATSELLRDATTFVDLQSPAMVEDGWTADLYPTSVLDQRDSTKHSFRPPNLDPELTSVILFPGQGSQYVGMGAKLLERDFPNVRRLFDTASHILKYDLAKLCTHGPAEQLHKTVHCQPAVFVCSMAALERLKHDKPQWVENCIATAGFSVGEYAALVFAGALSFEDALAIIKIRAEAMQAASETCSSGMMTVFLNRSSKLTLAMAAARQWVSEQQGHEPVCSVANFLFPECKVIGAEEEALKFIENNASTFNIRCKRLRVSGAFHTRLMKPAAEAVRLELPRFRIGAPLIHVHSNLDGKPYSMRGGDDGAGRELARKLVKQIYAPVQWEQMAHVLYDRDFFARKFPQTIECGPGRHLGLMLKHAHARAYLNYRHVFEEDEEKEEEGATQ